MIKLVLHNIVRGTTSWHRRKHTEARDQDRSVFEVSLSPMFIMNGEGRVVDANAAFFALTGYSRAEIIGHHYRRWVHPDEVAAVAVRVSAARAGSLPSETDRRLVHKDGSVLDVITLGQVLTRDPVTVLVTYRDVTDQHAADRGRIASDERYRVMVENSLNSVMLTDIDGRILMCNEATTRLLGYPREEIVGRMGLDFVHPDDRAALAALRAAGNPPRHVRRRLVHRSGSTVETEAAASPVIRDGRFAGSVISHKDVTQQIFIEAALQLKSAALEATAEAVAITDRDGIYEWVNPSFIALTGYSAEETIGKNLQELVKSGVQNQAFYQELWDTILAGQVWRHELTNRHKGGGLYAEEQTVTPVKDADGQIRHFIIVSRDLSERRVFEAARMAARAGLVRAELLAVMSHELRAPLNSILGFAQLLAERADEPLSEAQQHDVADIMGAGQELLRLVTDILDASKLEAGAFELHPLPFDPSIVIVDTVGAFRVVASKQHTRLTIEPLQLVHEFLGDPHALRRILTNLISNAVKFSEWGSVTVGASMQHEALVLTVQDTGIGIAPDQLEHVFEPFAQVDKESGRSNEGTGLGLTIARRMATVHGGSLGVQSALGRGTSFTVILPPLQPVDPSSGTAETDGSR